MSTTQHRPALDTTSTIPEAMTIALAERFDDADEWIQQASGHLHAVAAELGLEFLSWHPRAKRSLVGIYTTASGITIVGKACAVNHQATADMLQVYADLGIGPQVIHADAHTVFMTFVPETEPIDAGTFADNIEVVRKLLCAAERVQPPSSLPTLRDRFAERLDDARRRAWALPYGDGVVDLIAGAADVLCGSFGEPDFACHGDTAPRNVLISRGELWVIDPEPHRGFVEIDAVKLLDALELPVLPGVKELGLDVAIAEAYLPIQRGTTELYEAVKAKRL